MRALRGSLAVGRCVLVGWCALVVLLTASAVRAQSAPFAAEVPLLDCDGTPCVEAQIGGGKVVRLGIDTGNVNSVVDTSTAEAAGLKAVGTMPPGAPEGMFRTEIASLKIGGATLKNLPALVMGLGAMISSKQMPRVDGTLAYTAFKNRVVLLDFAAHKFRISDEQAGSPAKCDAGCEKISLVTFGADGPEIVVAQGFEINGKKVSAQVDTMYAGSLLIYTAAIEKLGLSAAAKTTKVRDFPFTDGGVQMKEAAAAAESFHGIALGGAAPMVYFPAEADVHEPDGLFEGTVGLEMLAGTVVTLDFHGMTISVRK
ncbi:MAG TPA: retropepsin-like aspartic protease [Candidatus Saccharimonadales bacterium]|nr:retropepsin-like aspartic protease [Candidatus Saccharimonadales bacterium]